MRFKSCGEEKEKGTNLGALGEESHTSALLQWFPEGLLTACPPILGDTLLVPKLSKARAPLEIGSHSFGLPSEEAPAQGNKIPFESVY